MKSNNEGMVSRDARVVAARHHISSQMGNEFAILNLGTGMYHGLEGVGARVWQLLAKPCRVGDVEQILLREYDVDPGVLRRDLDRLLHGLLERGLVEVVEGSPSLSSPPE